MTLDGMLTTTKVEGTPFIVVGTKLVKARLPEVVVRVERMIVGTITSTTVVGVLLIVVGIVRVDPTLPEVTVVVR